MVREHVALSLTELCCSLCSTQYPPVGLRDLVTTVWWDASDSDVDYDYAQAAGDGAYGV
jgi:hypothetical protein